MGEAADMMLEGILCAGCGEWLGGDGNGYPEYCETCQHDEKEDEAELKKQGKKLADSVTKKMIKEIEKHFQCSFDPNISHEFCMQMGGIIRGLYANGQGFICHKGLLATVENNRRSQLKAIERKQKKKDKANAK